MQSGIEVFFSGAPKGGFQTYPAAFKFANGTDTNNSSFRKVMSVHEYEGNRVVYSFIKYDFKTFKGGRTGSNFGAWVVVPNQYLPASPSNIEELDEFFQNVFGLFLNYGIISEEDGNYVFNLENFSDREVELEKFISLIKNNFEADFGPKMVAGLQGFNAGTLKSIPFKESVPSTPARPVVPTTPYVPVSDEISDFDPIEQVPQADVEKERLRRKAKQQTILSVVLGVILFLMFGFIVYQFLLKTDDTEPLVNDPIAATTTHPTENPTPEVVPTEDPMGKEENPRGGQVTTPVSNPRPDKEKKPITAGSTPSTQEEVQQPVELTTSETPEEANGGNKTPQSTVTGVEPQSTTAEKDNQKVAEPKAEEEKKPKVVTAPPPPKTEKELWTGDGQFVRQVPNQDKTVFKYYLNRDNLCKKIEKVKSYNDFLKGILATLKEVSFFENLKITSEQNWQKWFLETNKKDLGEIRIMIEKAEKDYPGQFIYLTEKTGRNSKVSNFLLVHPPPTKK